MEEKDRKTRLRRSIICTTATYFAMQSALFLVFAVPGGFFSEYGIRFFAVSFGFHIFLLALLNRFMDDFVKENDGEKLKTINLANRVTLVRVSTLPTLMFLVVAAKNYSIRLPLLVLVVLIFATDFLDGYISRKGNQVTRVGRMMDSASDYTLLFVLTLVFRYYSLIPTWFQLIVLVRLSIQVFLVAILIRIRKKIEPKTTFMGKLAVASIMVAYSVEVLGLIVGGLPQTLKSVIEYLVAAILAASIIDKIVDFFAVLGSPRLERRTLDGSDKERS